MNMNAQVKRSMRTIMAELEFLADSNLISASDLAQITTILNKASTGQQVPQTDANPPIPSSVPTIPTASNSPPPNPSTNVNALASNFNSMHLQPAPTPPEETPQIVHQLPPAPPPPYTLPSGPRPGCRGKALYDFNCSFVKRQGRLSFHADDTIIYVEEIDENWWQGEVVDPKTGAVKRGMFPLNYVQIVSWDEDLGAKGGTVVASVPPPPLPVRRADTAMGPGYIYGVAGEGSSAGNPEEHKDKSKIQSGGEKFGRKLGNAAIFGAGATIGSKIVNTIF